MLKDSSRSEPQTSKTLSDSTKRRRTHKLLVALIIEHNATTKQGAQLKIYHKPTIFGSNDVNEFEQVKWITLSYVIAILTSV